MTLVNDVVIIFSVLGMIVAAIWIVNLVIVVREQNKLIDRYASTIQDMSDAYMKLFNNALDIIDDYDDYLNKEIEELGKTE